MSRLHKTGKQNRSTYIYHDCHKKRSAELRPGENGVSEEDIAMLHELDDYEVNINRREERRTPHRLSIGVDGNHEVIASKWLRDESSNPEAVFDDKERKAEHEEKIRRLMQAKGALPPKQQWLYENVFEKKRSYVDIAREEGVSETAIRNRLKKMLGKLEKLLT